ncbi:MAG TPA: response regulator transcription factor [Planctomycetota bacterium]|nr:response regulator transcription factor [Planctomycetota bacterium]
MKERSVNPATAQAPTEQPPARNRRKVFLVDDHAVVRNGLAELINQASDLIVVGEAATAEEALEKIDAGVPDIAIVDLTLGDMSGLELLKHLKSRQPLLPVLVLSMHDESFYAERCLRAGARGYIMKNEAIEQVEIAVRQILDGKVYLSQRMSDQFLLAVARGDAAKIGSPVNQLSDRELEVFECIGRGLGASEIARKLHLSVKTIESYQAKLKEKLHLKDSSQLFQHALHWVERR